MATADLRELKPAFLDLIDLIRTHRIKTLGKTTPVSIPKAEIDAIAPPHKLQRMFEALSTEGIIGEIKGDSGSLIFQRTQTAENMLAFKRSLIIEGSLGLQIRDHSGFYYDMIRSGYDFPPERLSNEEGKLLYYLVDRADKPVAREEIANLFRLSTAQISSRMNSIRRKLSHLGFSKEETEQILPPYLRDSVVFNII